jgi:hypothetical protein
VGALCAVCCLQEYILTPPDQVFQVLMGVLKAHMADEPDSFKVRNSLQHSNSLASIGVVRQMLCKC